MNGIANYSTTKTALRQSTCHTSQGKGRKGQCKPLCACLHCKKTLAKATNTWLVDVSLLMFHFCLKVFCSLKQCCSSSLAPHFPQNTCRVSLLSCFNQAHSQDFRVIQSSPIGPELLTLWNLPLPRNLLWNDSHLLKLCGSKSRTTGGPLQAIQVLPAARCRKSRAQPSPTNSWPAYVSLSSSLFLPSLLGQVATGCIVTAQWKISFSGQFSNSSTRFVGLQLFLCTATPHLMTEFHSYD